MLTGSPRATYLEQAADGCLYLPACLWREQNVKLILTESNEWKLLYEKTGIIGSYLCFCATCFGGIPQVGASGAGLAGVGIISIVGSSLYAIASIAFAPLLAVGTCLKSVALSQDSQAKEYNQLVVDYLNKFPYDCEEKYVIEASTQKKHAEETKALNATILKQLDAEKSTLEKRYKALEGVQISASVQAIEESTKLLNDHRRTLALEIKKIQRKMAELNEMDANHEDTRINTEKEFEIHNSHPLINYVQNLNSASDGQSF
jgi:hypothetical protein